MKPAPSSLPPARRKRAALAVGAMVALAIALRAWRLRQGLPDFLDEAIPFKQALAMWGWDRGHPDLNPHFFNYPTFSIYLHLAVQKLYYAAGALAGRFANPNDFRLLIETDPTGPVIAARLLCFAADGLAVWGAWRVGERLRAGAGPVAACLVAFSPTLIGTACAIQVDSVMAALSIWALERLLAWQAMGGRRSLAVAVVLAGLAAGAKYTAGLLVVPLAWALWARDGARGLRRWPLLAAAAAGVFLLSSPYVALDFPTFWQGLWSESLHMAEGHLGVEGRTGALFYARAIVADLGLVATAALLLSLLGLRRREPARAAVTTMWAALLPQLAALANFHMEADRYLAPILAPAACLAGAAALETARRVAPRLAGSPRLARAVPVLLLAAMLLPAALAGTRAARSGRDSTQQQARRWCEANLGPRDVLVSEAYGPVLPTEFGVDRTRGSAWFAKASADARRRFLARRVFQAPVLPMTASGRIEVSYKGNRPTPLVLTVFAHAPDFNEAFYDHALLDGVDYFVTSAAVRRRYTAAPSRYPRQNAFYARLAATAAEAARFSPGGAVTGPEIVVYRLGPPFWDDLHDRGKGLDLFWWTRPVPLAYRLQVEQELFSPEQRSGGDVLGPSGATAGWVRTLREPFAAYVQLFSLELAQGLAQAGRLAPARQHAAVVLAVDPASSPAVLLFSYCARRQGDLAQARRALAAALQRQEREKLDTTTVRLEYGQVLAQLGEAEAGRQQLELVLRTATAGSPEASGAAALLARLPTPDAPAPRPSQ